MMLVLGSGTKLKNDFWHYDNIIHYYASPLNYVRCILRLISNM